MSVLIGLVGHPAVTAEKATAQDLSSFIEVFGDYARGRVLSGAAAEYTTDKGQRYQQLTFDDLLIELVDELADIHNYAAMLATKTLALYGALTPSD